MSARCKVLGTRKAGQTQIAHVQIGQLFGDVPCSSTVKPGLGKLKMTFKTVQGRLTCSLFVLPETASAAEQVAILGA